MLGGGGISAGKVEVELSAKFDKSGIDKFSRGIDGIKDQYKSLGKSSDQFHKGEDGRWRDSKGRYVAAEKGMGRLSKASGRLKQSIGTGLKVGAAAGAAAIGTGLVFALKESIVEAREAAKVMRLTENAIKASGGAAKISAKGIESLSTKLSNKTAIDDETIQSSANLLLTFRNIRNEVGKNNDIFNQATATALDMSVAYAMDLPSATKMLAKALQDPAKAAGALKKSGAIDETGVEKIKKMAESGASTLELQKTLLNDINKAGVKGAAEAAADPFQRLVVIFKNFLEDIGENLLPLLNKGADALSKFFNEMMTGTGAGGEFRKTLESIWEVAKNLWPVISTIGKVIFDVVRAFASLPAPVQATILTLGSLLALSIKLFGAVVVFKKLFAAAKLFFGFIKLAPAMMGPVGLAITAIAIAAFLIIKNWDKVKKFLGKAWEWIKGAAKTLADFVINAAKKGFLGPVAWIITNWDKVVAFFRKLPDKIKGLISKIGSIILKPFKWVADKIGGVLGPIVGTINDIINSAKKAIGWAKKAKERADEAGLSPSDLIKPGGFLKAGYKFVKGKADGGIAMPGDMAFVGDSSKPEFVISQTGPREKNIGLVQMAADALGMTGLANGGATKMSKAEYNKRKKEAEKYRTGLNNQMTLLDERYSITDRRVNFDGKITANELTSLKSIIDQKIKNLKKQKKTFGLSRMEQRQLDYKIANLILDKKDLDKSFKEQTGGAGSMAEQLTAFNAERFAVLASFGGNIRTRSGATMSLRPSQGGAAAAMSSSTTNNSGKQITINQEFKERPEDPHVWTRDIQNEITSLI